MNPLIARVVYCVGLCFLAACAVIPGPAAIAPAPTATVEVAPTLAKQLAAATRVRVEASRTYGDKHPAVIKAAATEAALRAYAERTKPERFHDELVGALSDELASALAQRDQASLRFGDKHPEMQRTETLVRALTIVLNTEVRWPS
jgi:uncharacterized protein involved in exopolysaccharide biosynthesis